MCQYIQATRGLKTGDSKKRALKRLTDETRLLFGLSVSASDSDAKSLLAKMAGRYTEAISVAQRLKQCPSGAPGAHYYFSKKVFRNVSLYSGYIHAVAMQFYELVKVSFALNGSLAGRNCTFACLIAALSCRRVRWKFPSTRRGGVELRPQLTAMKC